MPQSGVEDIALHTGPLGCWERCHCTHGSLRLKRETSSDSGTLTWGRPGARESLMSVLGLQWAFSFRRPLLFPGRARGSAPLCFSGPSVSVHTAEGTPSGCWLHDRPHAEAHRKRLLQACRLLLVRSSLARVCQSLGGCPLGPTCLPTAEASRTRRCPDWRGFSHLFKAQRPRLA